MTPLPAPPSTLLVAGFIALAICLVVGVAIAFRSKGFALGAGIWLLLTGTLGHSGVLADFTGMPPRITFVLLLTFVGAGLLVFSRFGVRVVRLPLVFWVGLMAFRIPVELLIHRAWVEGVAPVQMTWSGMNFDIVSGVSAALLIPFVDRVPRAVLLGWNMIALGLVLWVVGVAILSMPTAIQLIQPDNVWVAHFPFVWLPTIAVGVALIGHLAIFRILLEDRTNE